MDSESEISEPVADSKIVETFSKPMTTAKSLSEVDTEARKHGKVEASLKPVTTAISSSEEEEETDSETETEQKVETDLPAVKPPADSSSKVEAPVTTTVNSCSSEEEETDFETETSETVADSKIVETSSKSKTTTKSLSEVEPDSSAVKRPADSNSVETFQKPATKKRSCKIDEGETKRVLGDDDKMIVGQEDKKNYFQKVWTEEDDITILQGIIDYQNETAQFLEKIRGLKKKYDNNHGKEEKKGERDACVFQTSPS
ncbi:hypothetical protein Bca4012_013025 [Brassica carinata]